MQNLSAGTDRREAEVPPPGTPFTRSQVAANRAPRVRLTLALGEHSRAGPKPHPRTHKQAQAGPKLPLRREQPSRPKGHLRRELAGTPTSQRAGKSLMRQQRLRTLDLLPTSASGRKRPFRTKALDIRRHDVLDCLRRDIEIAETWERAAGKIVGTEKVDLGGGERRIGEEFK